MLRPDPFSFIEGNSMENFKFKLVRIVYIFIIISSFVYLKDGFARRARVTEILEEEFKQQGIGEFLNLPPSERNFGYIEGIPADGQIFLVVHVHWDPSWIVSNEFTDRLLVPLIDKVLDRLESNPAYCFVMDGQVKMIEAYLDQLEGEQKKRRIKQLQRFSNEDRLILGPAYVQIDSGLSYGEDIVRNYLLARNFARKYGLKLQSINWDADSFLKATQFPQILKGFGIWAQVVRRLPMIDLNNLQSEYWVEAPDGTRILTTLLLRGFRGLMSLSETLNIAVGRIREEARKMRAFGTTPYLLGMSGYDQQVDAANNVEGVFETMRGRETGGKVIQATPQEYFRAVIKYIEKEEIELVTLENVTAEEGSRYLSTFPGIMSSRENIKQLYVRTRKLLYMAERLSSYTWLLGDRYPQEEINSAIGWVVENLFHDGITGVSSDEVYDVAIERFERSLKIAETLVNEKLKRIAANIDTELAGLPEGSRALVVYNDIDQNRDDYVKTTVEMDEGKAFTIKDRDGKNIPYQLGKRQGDRVNIYFYAEDIPAFGYKTYYVVPGDERASSEKGLRYDEDGKWAENDYVRIAINPDGTINLLDKNTGKEYTEIGYFESLGESGDEYTRSSLKDQVVSSRGKKAHQISIVEEGPSIVKFKIEHKLELPAGLNEDGKTRSEETRIYPIVSYITLTDKSRYIDFSYRVRNVVKDHLLRVVYPTDIITNYSSSQRQFDIVRKPNRPEPFPDDADIPDNVKSMRSYPWEEEVNSTHVNQGWVDVSGKEGGLALFNMGNFEYEILEGRDAIALTLLRCVGWVDREETIDNRTGPAGAMLPAWDAQSLGDFEFKLGIYPHSGDWYEGNVQHEAKKFNSELRVVETGIHGGKLPKEQGLVSIDSNPENSLMITAIKKAENNGDLIVRFYNILDKKVEGNLILNIDNINISRACLTNLAEEPQIELENIEGNTVSGIKVGGKKIVTLRISFRKVGQEIKIVDEVSEVMEPLKEGEEVLFKDIKIPSAITEADIEERIKALKAAEDKVRRHKKEVERVKKEVTKMPALKGREIDELDSRAVENLQIDELKKIAELATVKRENLELKGFVYYAQMALLFAKRANNIRTNEDIEDIEQEIDKLQETLFAFRTDFRISEFIEIYWKDVLQGRELK